MRSRNFIKSNREIIVIAHNIRSILNVGAILRTSEGFGAKQVFATGYSPNLECATDGSNAKLLPHVRDKLIREFHKSALGAEEIVDFHFAPNIFELINNLRENNFRIVGLEQDKKSILLSDYEVPDKVAILLGEEVNGIAPELREMCDDLVEIPMFGRKESFNVSVAAGIALYELSQK